MPLEIGIEGEEFLALTSDKLFDASDEYPAAEKFCITREQAKSDHYCTTNTMNIIYISAERSPNSIYKKMRSKVLNLVQLLMIILR